MKVTVRQLNAFGTLLHRDKRFAFAKEIRAQVRRAVEAGATEIEFPEFTATEKRICELIKKSNSTLSFYTDEHTRRTRI